MIRTDADVEHTASMILPRPWFVVRTRVWARDLPLSSLVLYQLSQPEVLLEYLVKMGLFHSSILSYSFRNYDPTILQVSPPLSAMFVVPQYRTSSVFLVVKLAITKFNWTGWQETKFNLNIFLSSDAKCKGQPKNKPICKPTRFRSLVFPSWKIPETHEE